MKVIDNKININVANINTIAALNSLKDSLSHDLMEEDCLSSKYTFVGDCKDSRKLKQFVFPFCLLDYQDVLFTRNFSGNYHYELKRNVKDWRKTYAEINNFFFKNIKEKYIDASVDILEEYEQYISKDCKIAEFAVNACYINSSLEKRQMIYTTVMAMLLTQVSYFVLSKRKFINIDKILKLINVIENIYRFLCKGEVCEQKHIERCKTSFDIIMKKTNKFFYGESF